MTKYTIQRGDTLSKIAIQFSVPIATICQANGITDPNKIYAGRTLIIPIEDFSKAAVSIASYFLGNVPGVIGKVAAPFGSYLAVANNETSLGKILGAVWAIVSTTLPLVASEANIPCAVINALIFMNDMRKSSQKTVFNLIDSSSTDADTKMQMKAWYLLSRVMD